MNAWYLVKNGPAEAAFELRESETPVPGNGQVLVEVEAFGLNYADVMARLGQYREAPPLPCVVGYEVVGRVAAHGPDVTGFTVGQRVVAFTRFGAYATHALTDHRAVTPIPEDMDNGVAAALATQYCTAYHSAYEMVNLQPGERVLVQAAAGGVGSALVQLAKLKGCVVFGTAGSNEKLEYLRSIGVDHPINYRTQEFDKEIARMLGDERLDVVFDSIGGKTYKKGRKLLGAGGRIVNFGAAGRDKKGGIFALLKLVFGFGFYHPIGLIIKSQAAIGVNMLRVADYKPHIIQRCMKAVVEMTERGELQPHCGARYKATELAQAHALLENRGSIGKIVVEW